MAAQRAITLVLGAALGTGAAAVTLTTAKLALSPSPSPPPPHPPPAAPLAAPAPVPADELLQAHVVFRHGARTPLSPKYWPAWGPPEWDVCGSAYAAAPIEVVTERGAPRPDNPDDARQVGAGSGQWQWTAGVPCMCACVGGLGCMRCVRPGQASCLLNPPHPLTYPRRTGQPALRRRVQQGRAHPAGPAAGPRVWHLAATALQWHPPAAAAAAAPRGGAPTTQQQQPGVCPHHQLRAHHCQPAGRADRPVP